VLFNSLYYRILVLLVGSSLSLSLSLSLLVLPGLHQPSEIESDALDYSMGAVLTQKEHHVAFHPKTFKATSHKYSTYEKGLHAITQAVKSWI
jgi:hypothetical protein